MKTLLALLGLEAAVCLFSLTTPYDGGWKTFTIISTLLVTGILLMIWVTRAK
jgi:hypothetical protein